MESRQSRLKFNLSTQFHQQLIDDHAWGQQLFEDLTKAIPEAHGVFDITSPYSEERFMGPQSAVKYRFLVETDLTTLPGCPFRLVLKCLVEYKPKLRTFVVKRDECSFTLDESRFAKSLAALGAPPADLETMSLQDAWWELSCEAQSKFVSNETDWGSYQKLQNRLVAGAKVLGGRWASFHWQLILLDTGDGPLALAFCNPIDLLHLNSMARSVIRTTHSTGPTCHYCIREEFEVLREQFFGPLHRIVRREYAITGLSSLFKGSTRAIEVTSDRVNPGASEQPPDQTSLEFHLLEWRSGQSRQPEVRPFPLEAGWEILDANFWVGITRLSPGAAWLLRAAWGTQESRYDGSGTVEHRHRYWSDERELSEEISEQLLEICQFEPRNAHQQPLPFSRPATQWWTLRSNGLVDGRPITRVTCYEQPGAAIWRQAFHHQQEPPWTEPTHFTEACLKLLELGFEVRETETFHLI